MEEVGDEVLLHLRQRQQIVHDAGKNFKLKSTVVRGLVQAGPASIAERRPQGPGQRLASLDRELAGGRGDAFFLLLLQRREEKLRLFAGRLPGVLLPRVHDLPELGPVDGVAHVLVNLDDTIPVVEIRVPGVENQGAVHPQSIPARLVVARVNLLRQGPVERRLGGLESLVKLAGHELDQSSHEEFALRDVHLLLLPDDAHLAVVAVEGRGLVSALVLALPGFDAAAHAGIDLIHRLVQGDQSSFDFLDARDILERRHPQRIQIRLADGARLDQRLQLLHEKLLVCRLHLEALSLRLDVGNVVGERLQDGVSTVSQRNTR